MFIFACASRPLALALIKISSTIMELPQASLASGLFIAISYPIKMCKLSEIYLFSTKGSENFHFRTFNQLAKLQPVRMRPKKLILLCFDIFNAWKYCTVQWQPKPYVIQIDLITRFSQCNLLAVSSLLSTGS